MLYGILRTGTTELWAEEVDKAKVLELFMRKRSFIVHIFSYSAHHNTNILLFGPLQQSSVIPALN